MAKFDCVMQGTKLIAARPAGFPWTATERKQFSIATVTVEPQAVADFDVLVVDTVVKASAISKTIVNQDAYAKALSIVAAKATLEADGYTITEKAK